MIISASRRTDIPHYYSDWFFNRLGEGFVSVRNPMNGRQVSRVPLNTELADGIVLWTKNPVPMMDRLQELAPYPYYFQFTLTGYGRDVEPGLPDKRKVLIPAFRSLAGQIGPKRMVWRYDPVLMSDAYTTAYHAEAFAEIAAQLRGCTDQVFISFVDLYRKIKKKVQQLGIREPDDEEVLWLAESFSKAARENGMGLFTCCEQVELKTFGIQSGSCIDLQRMSEIGGYELAARRDSSGRSGCGCAESIDIGTYGTCRCGCVYCYAAGSGAREVYHPDSPMLCDFLLPQDRLLERKCKTFRTGKRLDGVQSGFLL